MANSANPSVDDNQAIATRIKKRQAKKLLGVDSAVVELSRLNQHLADFQIYFDDAIGINTRITELSSVSFWARRAYRWNRRLHRVCWCCWFNDCFNRSINHWLAGNNATFNNTLIHDRSTSDRATVDWLTNHVATATTVLNWEALNRCCEALYRCTV